MRILVVEDEARIRDLLRITLEEHCFSVDTASDGERGCYLARTTDYDLILLDNMLPKAMGLEVCRHIRSIGKSVPIMMLSVKGDPASKAELLNAGADDYLSKPFSYEELLARIQALLRRPPQIMAEVLKADNLVLDAAVYRVERGGEDIQLTRKEFMLLKYLLRNKGFVVSRSMLLEHVWDMDADPFSNTVESHVASLRRKIERPKRKKLIRTVPGFGYRLEG
jgi:DNA-binding response OmpR family regulator